MVKITLDAETFKALASATRLTVLRSLDQRRKTLSELSRDLELNKATLHEHLALLSAAGLVRKRDDEGRKWIYYELTWTGQKILHPQETTTFNVLLGAGVLAAGGGIAMLVRALGLWAQTRDFSAAEPIAAPAGAPGVLAGAQGIDGGRDLTGDRDWTNNSLTTPGPESGGRDSVTGDNDGGGGGGGAMASASSSAPPTTNAAPMPPASSPSYAPAASSAPAGTSSAPVTSSAPATSTAAATSAPPTTSYAPSGGGGGSPGGATYASATSSPPPTMTQPPPTSAPATYTTTQAPSYTSPAPAYTTSQAPPAATGTYPPAGQPQSLYANNPESRLAHSQPDHLVGAGVRNIEDAGDSIPAAPAEAPAKTSVWEEFADDGGWLGLAMLASAALFTTLALLLRRRLRPEGSPLIGAGAIPGGDGDGEGEGDDEGPDGPAMGADVPGSGDGPPGSSSDAAPPDDGLERS